MYDSVWARGIVDEFRLRHLAGMKVVDRLYHLPVEYAERLLIRDASRWRGYKALVKHLEDSMALYEKGYSHSRDCGSKYYTFDKYLRRVISRRLFPASLDLLDVEIAEDYSSEAQRRDGAVSAPAEPLQLPLFAEV